MAKVRANPPSAYECSYISAAAPHRRRRLVEEQQRLQRRLNWAERSGDHGKVQHLEGLLCDLDDALAQPDEHLEGSGRAHEIRRRYGDEMARALGW